jgi:AbrB family looped-hinge helix DNA binding protein
MAHIAEASKTEKYRLQLGERGRIVIPARVRERLKLNPGDRLILILDESGGMNLVSLNQQIEKCRGMFAHKEPHRIASEELIAERREEARREELE